MNIKTLLNPFIKIAGLKSLLYGLGAMILASIIGYFSHTHFDGVLSVHSGWSTSWYAQLAEPLLNWLFIGTWFYAFSLILSPSKVRAIDIFGTQAFAFIPIIPTSFSGFFTFMNDLVQRLVGVDPTTFSIDMLPVKELVWAIILTLFIMLFVVWSAIWIYNGFKISSNMGHNKVIPVYIAAIILGMFVPHYFHSLIF